MSQRVKLQDWLIRAALKNIELRCGYRVFVAPLFEVATDDEPWLICTAADGNQGNRPGGSAYVRRACRGILVLPRQKRLEQNERHECDPSEASAVLHHRLQAYHLTTAHGILD